MPPVDSGAGAIAARLDSLLPAMQRPARYSGGEWNSVVKTWSGRLRLALVYPDVYEESICDQWTLAVYARLNSDESMLCERAYLPWPDMDDALLQAGLPLYSLESKRDLAAFDAILVVLADELAFPGVLTLLQLARLPLHRQERGPGQPLLLGIGPCTANPEPLADTFDAFIVGEVEPEIVSRAVSALLAGRPAPDGVYIPAADDGTSRELVAHTLHALPPPLERPLVPFVEARRERGVVALQWQPVYAWIGQPARRYPVQQALAAVEAVLASTGYDHIQLSGWHDQAETIADSLSSRYAGTHTHFSFERVPMAAAAVAIAGSLPAASKGGITFAPTEAADGAREEMVAAARRAFRLGWRIARLDISAGAPGDEEALAQLARLARQVRDAGREEIDGQAQTHVTAIPYVARALGPHERAALPAGAEWEARLQLLGHEIRGAGLRLAWRALETRLVRQALARGDRRLGGVIEQVWRSGARRPLESENVAAWQAAFAGAGLDLDVYATRRRPSNEALPWARLRVE